MSLRKKTYPPRRLQPRPRIFWILLPLDRIPGVQVGLPSPNSGCADGDRGLCYLTNSFAYFLAPGFAASLFPYIQVPSLIGEGSLTLSLIVIGVNVQRWKERASAADDWRS